MIENVIEVTSLSKIYSSGQKNNLGKIKPALQNINFSLKKGESLGVIGKNGSGKSTLLKILAGILKPSSGEVKISGNYASILEFGGGFHPDLTGIENVFFAGELLGFKKKIIQQFYNEIIEFSELPEGLLKRPVKSYSSGQFLRLVFSIYSNLPIDILIIDEVLGVGDKFFLEKSLKKIKDLQNKGVSFVFATHDLKLLVEFFPNSIVLERGLSSNIFNTQDAIEHYNKLGKSGIKKHFGAVKNIEVNDDIIVRSIFLERNLVEFSRNENVVIKLEFDQISSTNYDFVLNINSLLGPVLTDCILYKNDSTFIKPQKGKRYQLTFEIPKLLLNIGTYFVNIALGDKEKDVFYFEEALKIIILPENWEKNKLWANSFQKYPIKPNLTINFQEIETKD